MGQRRICEKYNIENRVVIQFFYLFAKRIVNFTRLFFSKKFVYRYFKKVQSRPLAYTEAKLQSQFLVCPTIVSRFNERTKSSALLSCARRRVRIYIYHCVYIFHSGGPIYTYIIRNSKFARARACAHTFFRIAEPIIFLFYCSNEIFDAVFFYRLLKTDTFDNYVTLECLSLIYIYVRQV